MENRKIKNGFSMIEVLVAIGIFSIAILSAFSLIPLATKMSVATENETVASNLAQGIVEEALSLGYEQIAAGDSGVQAYTADPNSPYSIFEKQLIVEWVDQDFQVSAQETGLKRIKTIIYWHKNGQSKQYDLVTTLAKR